MKRIAIIGLGQVGGSIVIRLRNKQKPYFITGIDTSRKRLHLLRDSLDHGANRWDAAATADLVVVCLHYSLTEKYLVQANPNRLVMDVCSGKAKLVRLANNKQLRFIGGHPMAGNEFAVEQGWRKDLFEKAPFFLCPSASATDQDLATAKKFVRDLGAKPSVVDALQHDRFVAITSHFPTILANMLSRVADDVPSEFRGPGFQSMTRLAKTSPDLMKTFLESNEDQILRAAKQMQKLLKQWIKSKKAL